MFRIIIADWRRLLIYTGAASALWIFLLVIIYRDMAGNCCLQDADQQPRLMKLLFLCLVYGGASGVFWAQSVMYDPARLKLTETLPLSTWRLNLNRILTAVMLMVPGAFCWAGLFLMWRHFELPIPLWVPVFALLLTLAYILVCLRLNFLRVLPTILFPLLFIPDSEKYIHLHFITSPWPSIVLALAMIAFGWWAVRQPPPRWSRKC
jgi:hypothetical protein